MKKFSAFKTQTKTPQVTFIKKNKPKNINKSISSNFHLDNILKIILVLDM